MGPLSGAGSQGKAGSAGGDIEFEGQGPVGVLPRSSQKGLSEAENLGVVGAEVTWGTGQAAEAKDRLLGGAGGGEMPGKDREAARGRAEGTQSGDQRRRPAGGC